MHTNAEETDETISRIYFQMFQPKNDYLKRRREKQYSKIWVSFKTEYVLKISGEVQTISLKGDELLQRVSLCRRGERQGKPRFVATHFAPCFGPQLCFAL